VIALLDNPKWEAFCLHYAKTGNASEAYKQAGYSPKTEGALYAAANRLLKSAKVKTRLEELAAEMATDKIAGIREVQERLSAILRGEIAEEKVMVNGMGDLERYKIINQANQIKCAELLAKMQGGFDSRIQLEVTVPVFDGEGDLLD
jgi:phage terminase small subunit